MRLAKFMAHAGAASRRKSEELIRKGKVTVEGKTVFDPALDVNTDNQVMLDGVPLILTPEKELTYVIFNKPQGVLSTLEDPKSEAECIPDYVQVDARIYPVGRLDQESSGLLLLTNDGDLTNALTHPRRKIEKEYIAKLHPALKLKDYHALKKGIAIDDRNVEIDKLESLSRNRVRVVIHEGRKRILRRLFGHLEYNVVELKRMRIGTVGLGTLGVGKWRYLNEPEVSRLKKLVK